MLINLCKAENDDNDALKIR